MTESSRLPLVAVAQVRSSCDPQVNLGKAKRAVEVASALNAHIIVFPEYFMAWKRGGWPSEELRSVAQPVDGPFVRELSELARAAGMWLIAGIVESVADPDGRPFNTTVIIDGAGAARAAYRKSHLFDAFAYQESANFTEGDSVFSPIETPLGKTGLFVCYELRFPEVALSQALAGATVMVIPSAWVAGPLKDAHWSTLLRARAIENGCYVVAAAQVGNEFCGQSLIVDPMGVVVSRGSEEEGVIFASIDKSRVERVRATVPSLAHRRPGLYRNDGTLGE